MLFSRTGLVSDPLVVMPTRQLTFPCPQFIDTFTCQGPHDGLVLLHGYGNVFERNLQPGESLDIEPGAWLWKDPSVSMQTINILQSQGSGRTSNMMSGMSGKFGGKSGGGFFSKVSLCPTADSAYLTRAQTHQSLKVQSETWFRVVDLSS